LFLFEKLLRRIYPHWVILPLLIIKKLEIT
jgi:hypothetical protein